MQDEDDSLSLGQLVESPHGIATVIFEVISTLGMLPFIYIEVCSLIEYGPWGWLDFWCAVGPIILPCCTVSQSCAVNADWAHDAVSHTDGWQQTVLG